MRADRMELGRAIFEACMRERLLNDIRGWDRREYEEDYGGSKWQCVSRGLKPDEKAKWERLSRIPSRSRSGGGVA